MRALMLIAGMAAMVATSQASAAKLAGKIVITDEFMQSLAKAGADDKNGARDYYWKRPNGIIPVLPPRVNPSSDLAVVLFPKEAKPPKSDEVKTVIVQAGKLDKSVIVIRPMGIIRFQNESPFNHELYSPQLASFKPELQSTTAMRELKFTEEGVFEVRCKLMPNFLGYVLVTSGMDVEVKADGTIEQEVEPGEYTMKVFNGGNWVHKSTFTVEGGRMDPLEIKLAPGQRVGADEETQAASKPDEKSDSNTNGKSDVKADGKSAKKAGKKSR